MKIIKKLNYDSIINYCENYQNVTQRREVSKCYWKNDAGRLVWRRVATNLQFLKTALSVKHNKTRYACDLHFVDEKVEAQRGDDLPKVTQLVSDRLRVRLWDSCHLIPGLLAGVVPLWCSGRKRERVVRTPFLCQSSCISWWWCCFSPWSVLSGRTPREQIGKLMSLFLTLRTVHLPQTLSQISLHKASQQQSPTLGPAKKQPPCPELGVTNPSLL